MQIAVVEDDLLTQDVHAIVNASNTHLEHMGGLAGAISKAAGKELQKECRKLRPVPTGEAVITLAYKLPQKYVIHAVGPIWRDGDIYEKELLYLAHQNALRLADEQNLRTIAFPAISCGIFGFPVQEAAPIAMRAVRDWFRQNRDANGQVSVEEVRFCLPDSKMYEAFRMNIHLVS